MDKVTVSEGCEGGLAGMRVRVRSPLESGRGATPGAATCSALAPGMVSKFDIPVVVLCLLLAEWVSSGPSQCLAIEDTVLV